MQIRSLRHHLPIFFAIRGCRLLLLSLHLFLGASKHLYDRIHRSVRPSVGPSICPLCVFWFFFFFFFFFFFLESAKMGQKGQKWLSTSLQDFSFYLSLSICLSISHSQSLYRSLSFTIFLSQSFFHNLSFSIIPSQYFFDNLSFTVFLPHSFYHHLSFTIFFSQSVFIDLYFNLCKMLDALLSARGLV